MPEQPHTHLEQYHSRIAPEIDPHAPSQMCRHCRRFERYHQSSSSPT